VRDLGEAHVVALEKEAAGGERMIVRAGVFAYQKWDDLSMKTMLTISRSLQASLFGKIGVCTFFDDFLSILFMTAYDIYSRRRQLSLPIAHPLTHAPAGYARRRDQCCVQDYV